MKRSKYAPCVGDTVEYIHEEHVVEGILAEVWTSDLSGKTRARVVDFSSERKDEEAGKQLYYDRLRLPAGHFH